MKRLELIRDPDQSIQTLGKLFAYENDNVILKLASIELAWKDNKRKESCIPIGTYSVKKRWSPKHGHHFHIQNVPQRDMILMHVANHSRQLLGCIAPGLSHMDIDKDGLMDVRSSSVAMKKLYDEMPNEFEITIK